MHNSSARSHETLLNDHFLCLVILLDSEPLYSVSVKMCVLQYGLVQVQVELMFESVVIVIRRSLA